MSVFYNIYMVNHKKTTNTALLVKISKLANNYTFKMIKMSQIGSSVDEDDQMVEASRVDENVQVCSNPWIKSIRSGLSFVSMNHLIFY